MKKNCILFTALMLLLCTACDKKEPIEEVESEPPVKEEEPVLIEPEILEEEPVLEEEIAPEPEPTAQEKARAELVEKHGVEVVEAWETFIEDRNLKENKLIVHEFYGPEGFVYYECYKLIDNGEEWAGVGGGYYVYGEYISEVAIFDLVEYHNQFVYNK